MKITDLLRRGGPLISFEFFPPKTPEGDATLLRTIDALRPLRPSFVSVTRTGENDKMPIADNIWLAKAAKGPVRRMGLEHVMGNYVIWKFADNVEGAKKFLVDLVGNYTRAFEASEGYNFPCFQKTVPDIKERLAKDSKAKPPDKYAVLTDALDWATNVGYPGYANAAIGEIYSTWVLNTMFAQAATGAMSPEDSVKEADAKCRKIWQKWKEKKLL